jgi:phage-related baseplate assembly protein
VFAIAAGDLIVQQTATGALYANPTSFSLGALGTVVVPMVAVEPGTASNASANVPMTIVTSMLGVTVTANTAIVGRDEETDDELKAREQAAIDALSPNGPSGAYLAAAASAKRGDGTSIGVTRVKVSAPSSYGFVTATVATSSGQVTGTVGVIGDDLDYVDKAIQYQAVPLGITCVTYSATTLSIPVTYTLYVHSTESRTDAQLKDAATSALTTFLSNRNIGGDGGYVFTGALAATILSISQYAYRCEVTLPAGASTAIGATQIPILGTVTQTSVVRS